MFRKKFAYSISGFQLPLLNHMFKGIIKTIIPENTQHIDYQTTKKNKIQPYIVKAADLPGIKNRITRRFPL